MQPPPLDADYLNSLMAFGEPIFDNDHVKPFLKKVKRGSDFLSEYRPIHYVVDGVLPSGSLYAITGKRGTGKTAFLIGVTMAIITGRADLIGFPVEAGRVAYVALENPTDIRMKMSANAFVANVDRELLNDRLAVIDGRLPLPEIAEQLTVDIEENGEFQIVLFDTFQAGFAGGDFNDNAAVLAYARHLRGLTDLRGSPAVLVAAHPTKSAGEDNLEPYGGGSVMNELDGNLTLWAADGQIKLSFNKVRGPEFEPRHFRVEKVSSPDILDNRGREILLPRMIPVSAEAAEERAQQGINTTRALLKAMAENPGGSQREWAAAIGRAVGLVNKNLQKLKDQRLVEDVLGKWKLTAKGEKEALNG
ncbi:AAA family ATPase [Beijerinckia mobilis]|uniref:AAA family ATPase n=1 Tax=Beijerinckia mobilis TaxID=231434 RepID=UPI00054F73A1|nr:AAA family ATPase [Beijerinckia mobilis]